MVLEDLTTRMTEVISQNQTQSHISTYDLPTAQIGIKLDGTNYALWSQVVEMYVSGQDKWDISMETSHRLHQQTRLFGNGGLKTQSLKNGSSTRWTRP